MESLEHWSYYTRFFLALIAVLDPFMAIPVFLGLCAGRDATDRRRLARRTALTVLAVLVAVAVVGEQLLGILGTSMASFRIAGGLVLLLMALAMLQAKPGDVRQTAAEAGAADSHDPVAGVIGLAIPLLAGPGAISTVMIAVQQGGWFHQLIVISVVVAVCFILWLMLRAAIPIGRALGTAGLNVANRLLGLLLAAIAVESMATGLRDLFPILAGGQ